MMKKESYNVGSQQIADRIDEESEGVEIGVWKGDTTEKFSKKAGHVHAVDSWAVTQSDDFLAMVNKYAAMFNIEPTRESFAIFYDTVYDSVVKRFADTNVTIYRMTSDDWFLQNTKTDYDWVYIDGDHSYDGCMKDLISSWEIIREGGVMYGDDIQAWTSVRRAVYKWCKNTNNRVVELGQNQWMVQK